MSDAPPALLLCCPHCGSTDLDEALHDRNEGIAFTPWYVVVCPQCGVETDGSRDLDKVVANWNAYEVRVPAVEGVPSSSALAPERIAEFSETIARIQRYADHRDYNDESSYVIAGHVEALLEVATDLLADRERFERRVGEMSAQLVSMTELSLRQAERESARLHATLEPTNG